MNTFTYFVRNEIRRFNSLPRLGYSFQSGLFANRSVQRRSRGERKQLKVTEGNDSGKSATNKFMPSGDEGEVADVSKLRVDFAISLQLVGGKVNLQQAGHKFN